MTEEELKQYMKETDEIYLNKLNKEYDEIIKKLETKCELRQPKTNIR